MVAIGSAASACVMDDRLAGFRVLLGLEEQVMKCSDRLLARALCHEAAMLHGVWERATARLGPAMFAVAEVVAFAPIGAGGAGGQAS